MLSTCIPMAMVPSRTTPITSPTVFEIVVGNGPQITASARSAGVALTMSSARSVADERARSTMRTFGAT